MTAGPVAIVIRDGVEADALARDLEAAGFKVLAHAASIAALTHAWPALNDRLVVGDLELDRSLREVRVGGTPVNLTDAEFDLLEVLARHAGDIVSREDLTRDLRGIDYNGTDRTIDLRVARVRRKLGDDARRPRFIRAVRGEGYLLIASAR